jgi:hypothetical protein
LQSWVHWIDNVSLKKYEALNHHDQQLEVKKNKHIYSKKNKELMFRLPLNICPIVKMFPEAAENKLLN